MQKFHVQEDKQGIKFKAGAIKCCNEKEITSSPNERSNIPFYSSSSSNAKDNFGAEDFDFLIFTFSGSSSCSRFSPETGSEPVLSSLSSSTIFRGSRLGRNFGPAPTTHSGKIRLLKPAAAPPKVRSSLVGFSASPEKRCF